MILLNSLVLEKLMKTRRECKNKQNVEIENLKTSMHLANFDKVEAIQQKFTELQELVVSEGVDNIRKAIKATQELKDLLRVQIDKSLRFMIRAILKDSDKLKENKELLSNTEKYLIEFKKSVFSMLNTAKDHVTNLEPLIKNVETVG